jgi:hypothetical protein
VPAGHFVRDPRLNDGLTVEEKVEKEPKKREDKGK